MTITVADAFADARQLQASALERLAAGDVRDAAEKAWCATKRATDAMVLALTGDEPLKSTETSVGLRALEVTHQGVSELVGRYYTRQSILHGECFYLGLCEPLETTERRIRETSDYIADAERLAAG